MKLSNDAADLLFRGLFCMIFLVLGAEHIFSDDLIRRLMPSWMPAERAVSVFCGIWMSAGGLMILLGWHLRLAALSLGVFLVLATLLVHVPGMMHYPAGLPRGAEWMWDILQRSNFIKNVCLLGVCFHLWGHRPGRYSLGYKKTCRSNAPD